ncbi:MAG: hypothetical protein NWF07_13315, partial [Candidatus Bathyarchaeota archaeon]|nr:hypothetical protein [Candidatus Bathyarchaeota archaeon]
MGTADYMPILRDRLSAAWGYIEDFNRESHKFFNTAPYRIVTEEEFKGSNKILRYRIKVLRDVPSELRRPVSACINELRPILDNAIWGLAQVVGACPSCGINFPIYCTEFSSADKKRAFEDWFRKNKRILDKFPARAVNLIRSLQPFNPDTRGNTGTSHILYLLNRLANKHKHQIPLKIAGVNRDNGIPNRGLGILKAEDGFTVRGLPALEHDSVLLEMTVPASQPTNS